jgi:hypothetical protein
MSLFVVLACYATSAQRVTCSSSLDESLCRACMSSHFSLSFDQFSSIKIETDPPMACRRLRKREGFGFRVLGLGFRVYRLGFLRVRV